MAADDDLDALEAQLEHYNDDEDDDDLPAVKRIWKKYKVLVVAWGDTTEASVIEKIDAWLRKGGTIVVVGVFGKKPSIDMGLIQDRELSVVGTLMYRHED